MKILFIGIVLVFMSSVSFAQDSIVSKSTANVFTEIQLSDIESALGDLILHEKEGVFLLVKESETKLFVEFSNDLRGHLLFDVPVSDLSEEQIDKLEALYKEFEIIEPTSNLTEAELEIVGKTGSFKYLGSDFDKGIDILSRVFTDVFGFEKGISIILER